MATIPTLIVAPAILAAGLTYKYAGGSDDISGVRIRRTCETGISGDALRQQQPTAQRRASLSAVEGRAGSRFESDFAPRVPSDMHRADAFVPTTMLTTNNVGSSTASGGGDPTVRSRAGGSGSAAYSPWKQILESNARGTVDHRSTYPNTTEDINRSSWLYRVAHKITGDLGSIEHQEKYHAKHPPAGQPVQPPLAVDQSVRGAVHKSEKDSGDANIHVATRAAEDVTYRGVRGTHDANQAANVAVARNDAERQQKEGGGGWFSFLGTSHEPSAADRAKQRADDAADVVRNAADDVKDSAKHAADETRGWLWGKKQEADDAAADAARDIKRRASDASDAAKHTADEARGWFWSKKQEADDAVAGAKHSAYEAKQAAQDTADETRGWFWSKKQETDEKAADAARDIKRRASDASDTVKHTAEETRGWLSSKKQQADEAAADTARDVRRRASNAADSVKQTVEDTADSARGWFWDTKQQADDAAADAARDVKRRASNASDSVKQTMDGARQAAEDTADSARGWLASKKQQADDAARDAAESARQTADDAHKWAADKTDQVRSSMDDARDWAADKKNQARTSIDDARSQIDRTVAGAADSVAGAAESLRDTARSAGDSARRNADAGGWDIGSYAVDSPVAGEKLQQRRDSAFSTSSSSAGTAVESSSFGADNSVLGALDEKFSEARARLRGAGDELRSMAEDAGARASERLRDAGDELRSMARAAQPVPSNQGLVVERSRYSPAFGVTDRLRFVEDHSGIPVLSSTSSSTMRD